MSNSEVAAAMARAVDRVPEGSSWMHVLLEGDDARSVGPFVVGPYRLDVERPAGREPVSTLRFRLISDFDARWVEASEMLGGKWKRVLGDA